jgi:hypothetical protein
LPFHEGPQGSPERHASRAEQLGEPRGYREQERNRNLRHHFTTSKHDDFSPPTAVGARSLRAGPRAGSILTRRLRLPPHRAVEWTLPASATRGTLSAPDHPGALAAKPPLAIVPRRAGKVLLLSRREIAGRVRPGQGTAARDRLRHVASRRSGLSHALRLSAPAAGARSPGRSGGHREHSPTQPGEPVQSGKDAAQESAVLGSALDANAVCELDVCGHGMLQL